MLGATTTGVKSTPVSIPPKMSELTAVGQRDWKTGVELLETCMNTHQTETSVCCGVISADITNKGMIQWAIAGDCDVQDRQDYSAFG